MAADDAALTETGAAGAVRARAFAALDRRLDPISRAPLAVGLSGGGDSLALLALVVEWARSVGRPVLALTVDHGLNPDSARWTADAGKAARALGADWRGLVWPDAKPSTGLPAAARRARHTLLADAARNADAKVLLLGHTGDDRAESELIRRETPTHGHLHEWTPSPAWPQGRGLFVLRPLLGVWRRALRSVLADRGLGWLEDPANADPRFARTRARQALMLAVQPCPLLPEGWTRQNEDRRGDTGPWTLGFCEVGASGVVLSPLAGLSPDQLQAILGYAIACAAGDESPPRGAALARLAARLEVEAAGTATLGGARIGFAGEMATLCRELGRRPPPPTPLEPGAPHMFDGRFELVVDAPGWRVAPLAGYAARLPAKDRRGLADIPAMGRPALPVLLDDRGAARLPRPFADGPAQARELVGGRLAAALGWIDNERLLA